MIPRVYIIYDVAAYKYRFAHIYIMYGYGCAMIKNGDKK